MQNLSNEFIWWQGVVEDRDDPLMLGRCRVRIVGYHTEDKNDIPTESLPWAYQAMPINTRPNSVPVGPSEGTWVMGFFRDGSDCQEPIVTHVIDYGIQSENNPELGFNDPETNIDKPVGSVEIDVGEVNTNRLARGIISDTLVEKNQNREEYGSGVPTSNDGTWREPQTENLVSPKYPYNYVEESESGHVFEVDDTPGKERLSRRHRTGTFEEMYHDGSVMTKVIKDNYEVVMGNDNIHVSGNVNITSDSSINIKSTETIRIQSDNQIRFKAGTHIVMDAVGGVQVNGSYFSTTTGTPIFHGGGSVMVTPTGIPLFADNRTRGAAAAAKLNMAIAISSNMNRFRTTSMGPLEIASMVKEHLGFTVPLNIKEAGLDMLLEALPQVGDRLPVDFGRINPEQIKRLAENPTELAKSLTLGIIMQQGGSEATKLMNKYGGVLDFMNAVDWAGLQALMKSGKVTTSEEIYMHIGKIGESSIYMIEMTMGNSFDVCETLVIHLTSEESEIYTKKVIGEVIEFSDEHVTFVHDADTFDNVGGRLLHDDLIKKHKFFEGKLLYGTLSGAVAKIIDTVRVWGNNLDYTKIEQLVVTSDHRGEEPENELEWIMAIQTRGDLWNAIEETHGLQFLDFYKENLKYLDIVSKEPHPVYGEQGRAIVRGKEGEIVMRGILPRIGRTDFGGITTKEKLFHEIHVLIRAIPEGFTADNASDPNTSEGMVIKVASAFSKEDDSIEESRQAYKAYFEGIPVNSVIKLYEVRGDVSTIFPVSFVGGVDLKDLVLGNYLKNGSINIKWGNSIRVETYLDLAEYVGPLVKENKIISTTYPYQDGNPNTWVWDGRDLEGKFITNELDESFLIPFVYSIQSPMPIMKDSQGNLVCYENDELEEEFTSSKWGIIWVFKNPSVKDDTSTPITIGPAGTSSMSGSGSI